MKGERNIVDAHHEQEVLNTVPGGDESGPGDEIVRQRMDKLERLLSEEGYNPYILEKWERKHQLEYVRRNFDHLEADEIDESVSIVTAGRIMTLRKHGKAMFANLADETETMQLYLQFNAMGDEQYTFAKK